MDNQEEIGIEGVGHDQVDNQEEIGIEGVGHDEVDSEEDDFVPEIGRGDDVIWDMLNDPTCSSHDIAMYWKSLLEEYDDKESFDAWLINQVEWNVMDDAMFAKWDAAQELVDSVFTIKVMLLTGSSVDVLTYPNEAIAEFKKRLEKHEAMAEFKESYDLYYALSGNRLDVDTIPEGTDILVGSVIKVALPTGSFVDVSIFFNMAIAEFKERLEKHEAMAEFKESYDLYYALSGNRLDVDTIPKGTVIAVRSV